jgi:ferrous iron transport protein A
MTQELTLRALRPGEYGRVRALRLFGPLRRRLRELGLVEGAELCCLGRSPLGDPTAYSLCGAVLALRARESERILLERREGADGACDCTGGAAKRGKEHGL